MSKLILMGPMGSGKTTVGKKVAHELNLEFTDTDSLIEQTESRSITDIFVEDGEPYFRKIEAEIVQRAIVSNAGVLSLGGGAVMDTQTQNVIKKSSAIKIFLDISLAAVAPRVGFNNQRPLLLVNPRQKWQELMNQRRTIYESLADHVIDVSEKTIGQVATEIVGVL